MEQLGFSLTTLHQAAPLCKGWLCKDTEKGTAFVEVLTGVLAMTGVLRLILFISRLNNRCASSGPDCEGTKSGMRCQSQKQCLQEY